MSIHLYKGDLPAGLDLGNAIAIDTETMGLNPIRDRLCLVQMSSGDGVSHLVQIPKPEPGRLHVAPRLKAVLEDPNVLKIFHFARFDLAALAGPMAEVSRAQGLLMGRLADVGMALRNQASLAALTEDVVKTSEIEGEQLNVDSVRSSIARRLGVDIGALAAVDRHVDGVVEMVLDATAHCNAPVTRERLFGWHAALFPAGYSGLFRINVGAWRDDASGPLQMVSGPIGRQKVHFEAPPAVHLEVEASRFFDWVNGSSNEPPLLKAGVGHPWFVTLHPFDDGNGRIARAIGDLLLARADGSPQRCYSLLAQHRL